MRTPSRSELMLLMCASVACDRGTLLDVTPAQPGHEPGHAQTRSALGGVQCFWGQTNTGMHIPLSRVVHEIRSRVNGDEIDVAIVFNRAFVDNTYGVNAIGWDGGAGGRHRREAGHTFDDLLKSDHTGVSLIDKTGTVRINARYDYLATTANNLSGFATAGSNGGDGRLLLGDTLDFLGFGSSLDDNFNRFGYVLEEDSPATDASYAPNSSFPDWNFWVEYRMTVRASAFAPEGFAGARMDSVHASPSKLGMNTITVEEEPCPEPGAPDNPFPRCAQASLEGGCVDPSNGGNDGDPANGGSGGDSANGGSGGDSANGGSGGAGPGSGEGAECRSSSDCPAGYCSESGHCIKL